MKKRVIGCFCMLLVLVSCSPGEPDEDIIQNPEDTNEQEISIIPGNQLSSNNYKVILDYKTSAARGVIVNQVANRMDIDEMEEGLRRLSLTEFDPETYYFEEGQNLSSSEVYDWLGRDLTDKQLEATIENEAEAAKKAKMQFNEERRREELKLGLNPALPDTGKGKDEQIKAHRENPRYISHILEQNFLTKNEDQEAKLSGVSIAIALKSVYRFQVETEDGKLHGPYYEDISRKEMLKQGEAAAQIVLERLREKEQLTDVPIMIALYEEESQEHPVPGNYASKTVVPPQDMLIDQWETVDEKNVLFPSSEASKDHGEDENLFNALADRIATFFPNYVGVIGQGFYKDGHLQELSMLIPMEFQGSGEVTGFTQYLYGEVQDIYENTDYATEIKIESGNEVESIIYREAGEKEFNVHILH